MVHCQADFQRPVHGGDRLQVHLQPQRLDPCCFEVRSEFHLDATVVASGLIRHLAIRSDSRQRCALPEAVDLWLEASDLGKITSL